MAGSYLRVWAYAACVWAIVSLAPAAAQLPCVGDCDGDGMVSISELIRGVNISLGSAELSTCPEFDSSGDGMVAINELIQAVNAALQGCVGDQPTATPTGSVMPTDTPSTEPPDTPTATETPEPGTPTPDPGEQIAGAGAAVANSLSSIVNVVGAVVAGASGGTGGLAVFNGGFPGGGAGLDACELGGTVDSSITVQGLAANVNIDFDNCAVSRPGGSVVFDGNLAVTSLGLNFRGQGSFDAIIEFRDDQGVVSAVTDAIIQSPVALTAPAGSGPCAVEIPVLGSREISAIGLSNLTGTLSSTVPGQGAAEVTFAGTDVQLDILDSSDDCVPTEFNLTFNGDAQISQSVGTLAVTSGASVSFALEFVEFLMAAQQSGNQSLVSMSGDLIASCFGGSVTLSTPESLSFLIGQFCPGSGTISIQDIGEVIYSQEGVSVGGMTFASCLDPALLTCAE